MAAAPILRACPLDRDEAKLRQIRIIRKGDTRMSPLAPLGMDQPVSAGGWTSSWAKTSSIAAP